MSCTIIEHETPIVVVSDDCNAEPVVVQAVETTVVVERGVEVVEINAGPRGLQGFSVELRRGDTHLQWRPQKDGAPWVNLIPLAELEGAPGAGDMNASVYDPQEIEADVFDRSNHTGKQTLATISDAGTAAGADVDEFATAAQGVKADKAYGWGNHASAGYLTQHQSLAGYATQVWVSNQGYLTQHQDISFKENKFTDTSTSTDKTLADRERCTVTAAGQTITLPASPVTGAAVVILVGDFDDTVIARNGSTIMGLSENLTVDVPNVGVTLVFNGTTWRIA